MKRLLFIVLIFMIQCVTSVNGQPYYNNSGLIQGNGFTLQCFNDEGIITKLYTPGDTLVNTRWLGKDGSSLDEIDFTWTVRLTAPSDYRIVEGAISEYCDGLFSFFDKIRLRNDHFGICIIMYLDTYTDPGSVKEVKIELWNDESAINIPPAKYYQLIQWVKQNIRFNLTDAAMDLNYVYVAVDYGGSL